MSGPVGQEFIQAMGKGFIKEVAVNAIRKILNNSIKDVRPGQLLVAIRNNTSLWGSAEGNICQIAGKIPPSFISAGLPMYQKAVQEYGSATELVLEWLKEDNPGLYSLIINTDGGIAWFDHQVEEMTINLGLTKK